MSVTENLAGTRAGSIDATGSRSVQRHFTVINGTSLQSAIAEMDAAVELYSLFDVGTEINDNGVSISVSATYYGTKSWSRMEGSDDTWEFILTYTTAPSEAGGTTPNQGGTVLLSTQGDARATTETIYRKDPDATFENSPSAGQDIGGDSVDSGGTPTSVTTLDWRFSTTEKFANFPTLEAYATIAGKRNSSSYEGAGEGEVLYIGFSWSYDTSSGLWAITHQFAVDKKSYHAKQVAKTDPQGEVIKERISVENQEMYFAKHVYWVQMFPMASFGALPSFSLDG